MKNIFFLCCFLIGCQCNQKSAVDATSSSNSNTGAGHLLPGESIHSSQQLTFLRGNWICDEYLDSLRATKSPLAVDKLPAGLPRFLQIDGTKVRFGGDERYEIPAYLSFSSDTNLCFIQYPDDDLIATIRINSSDSSGTIVVTHRLQSKSRDSSFVFHRTEYSFKQLIIHCTIAGTYIGTDGHTYTFTETSRAIWPQMQFQFDIASESGLDDRDCIFWHVTDDSTVCYAYGWQKDHLLFYREIPTPQEEEYPPSYEKEPFLTLTPQ